MELLLSILYMWLIIIIFHCDKKKEEELAACALESLDAR
jgi:hypothetical protein